MADSLQRYDVVVVGASIAGCTAALFFAGRGLDVALVEKNREMDAYKKVCTHFIQASAVPTIERLGLAPALEDAGAIRAYTNLWTRAGWIHPPAGRVPYGYSVRRQVLDPMLRRQAAAHPRITLLLGAVARELLWEGERIVGVRATTAERETVDFPGRVVVGADGRYSTVAKLAGVPEAKQPNDRFGYFAYYRDLPRPFGEQAQMWLTEPDMGYTFPNDDGLTLLGAMPHKERLPAFREDVAGAFARFFRALPDAPDPAQGERVSRFLGMLDMPLIKREPVAPGLALVGDAALTSDPVWGIGCGWAFQTAEWLAEETAPALATGDAGSLDRALTRYGRRHGRALGLHHTLIASMAARRSLNPIERLMFTAAARDEEMAVHTERFGGRLIHPLRFLAPHKLARALWVTLRQG